MSDYLKKYWWFALLLIVAGYFLVANLVENRQQERETEFAVLDAEKIYRIEILHNNQKVLLQRTSTNSWLLNNNENASADAIGALLRVVTRLQLAGPVPISASDSLVGFIQQHGVEVKISSARKVIKHYWVASTSHTAIPNVAYLSGANNAYRVNLPSYEGKIANLFKTVPEYWIGNKVPMPSAHEISAVQVELPSNVEQSYRIDVISPTQFRLFHIYSGQQINAVNVDEVKELLSNLSQIQYHDIATLTNEERAAVIFSEPDFIFTIYTENGNKHELRVYPIPVDEYTDELGRTINVDLDRVYVTISGSKRVFIVKYIDMHSVLKGVASFQL